MNGAQWLVQYLKIRGVNIVFGYPGGAIMPIYDALFDGGLEHLLCRHEQGAVIAAIGYARAIGKVGVCFVTSGPGATNIITGLADALLDSIPIIAITGQVSSKLIGTDAFQEVDILGLSLSCTKHSFLVNTLESLPDIIASAFTIAISDRPGPVLIDIPKDIQLSVGNLVIPKFDYEKQFDNCSNNVFGDIKAARLAMCQAQRPVVYIGGGVGLASAVDSLRKFISITHIPSVVTLKGIGSPDIDDSCYLGMLGMHGNQAANLAVQKCDLLIAAGARFDDRVTGDLTSFAPFATVIHLDIDSAEFSKLRKANISLLGDLSYIFSLLEQPLFIEPWIKEVILLKGKYAVCKSRCSIESIYAPDLLKIINDKAPKNTVVTTDVGQHQMWVAQCMHFRHPQHFITSGGLGTMGFGVPAAIGAQIASPNSTVLCISGDGSFMINVQELATIKRKHLPIKILLLDNQRLGMVRQWQQLFFNQRYSETNLSDNPDFIMLAKSFGILGLKIIYPNQVNEAIDILFNHVGPFLLHVMINEFDNVWPLVPPGSCNEDMLEHSCDDAM